MAKRPYAWTDRQPDLPDAPAISINRPAAKTAGLGQVPIMDSKMSTRELAFQTRGPLRGVRAPRSTRKVGR